MYVWLGSLYELKWGRKSLQCIVRYPVGKRLAYELNSSEVHLVKLCWITVSVHTQLQMMYQYKHANTLHTVSPCSSSWCLLVTMSAQTSQHAYAEYLNLPPEVADNLTNMSHSHKIQRMVNATILYWYHCYNLSCLQWHYILVNKEKNKHNYGQWPLSVNMTQRVCITSLYIPTQKWDFTQSFWCVYNFPSDMSHTTLIILTVMLLVLMGGDMPNLAALASFFASADSSTPNFCARISRRCKTCNFQLLKRLTILHCKKLGCYELHKTKCKHANMEHVKKWSLVRWRNQKCVFFNKFLSYFLSLWF